MKNFFIRFWATFIKTAKENLRDWKIIILVITMSPAFVLLMHAYLNGPGAGQYNVVVVNDDKGSLSQELIKVWENVKTDNGQSQLKISFVSDNEAINKAILDRTADLGVYIPADFSSSYLDYSSGNADTISAITNSGDSKSARFAIASSLIDYSAFSFIADKTNTAIPLDIKYSDLSSSKSVSEFDSYVPALLVLAAIMVLFTSGASIIREVEKGTLMRLSMSKLKIVEFIGAVTLNQLIIGMLSMGLTLLIAVALGYRTSASIPALFLVGSLTSLSVVAISLITCIFIKNMFGLMTLGCFPFFLMVFFSDCFMPLPKINMFNISGHQLFISDLLPTATATRALQNVLNFNIDISGIGFELVWMLALTVVLFVVGMGVFRRERF